MVMRLLEIASSILVRPKRPVLLEVANSRKLLYYPSHTVVYQIPVRDIFLAQAV